jgi:hypothetical protein
LTGAAVQILPILEYSTLDSETLNVAAEAYDIAREDLRLATHIDPLTRVLARKVIEAVQGGHREPEHIAKLAIDALGAAVLTGNVSDYMRG